MIQVRVVTRYCQGGGARTAWGGCVHVSRRRAAFALPSGWASPVYMDCRRLISFPAIRRELVKFSIGLLRGRGALDGIESVAGAEASGIALAAWIADALDLPMQYVRKKPKGFRSAHPGRRRAQTG